MKISPVTVVGLIVTILSLVLFISGPGFVQAITNYAYDAFLRQTCLDPRSGTVVIVDLDDDSLSDEKYGQWPWPRHIVAKLTDKIFEYGASVVAFDIVFPERDRTSPIAIEASLNRHFNIDIKLAGIPDELADFDEIFSDSLKGRKTILGCYMRYAPSPGEVDESIDLGYTDRYFPIGKGSIGEHLLRSDKITISIPTLTKSSTSASFNAFPDDDNIVRSNPLVWGYGSRIYPALALEALRLHKGITQGTIRYDEQGILHVRLGKYVIPTDSAGRVVINYRRAKKDVRTGFSSSFPSFSAADVLEGKLVPGIFKNQIVFVGTSAVGLRDVKATPVSAQLSGVEVHATIVDNILADDVLKIPLGMVSVQALAIIIVGGFLTWFIGRSRSWLSFLMALAIILMFLKISLMMLDKYQLVFVPIWVIISVLILYPILTTIKYWQEERQKKRVRDMFGTMVSANVLHYLENNPDSFSLSGQRAEATMFFSDVANFTTIAENLEPGRLSDLLNRYLSPMTDIIMERGGYLDKYEGDLIMAEWGVPYPMHDHAVQGCLAAIEQQKTITELRPVLKEQFGHEIHVRMGINSGHVTAGNMGSDRRFQYTVMGDAVNQAARFEPANKSYDTRIIIGSVTYEEAKDAIEARLLDRVVVKGKTKPIEIYELLEKAGDLDADKKKSADLYVDALRYHWDREWQKAIDALDRALGLDPGDGPSARLRERVMSYMATPPRDDWAGEVIRTEK